MIEFTHTVHFDQAEAAAFHQRVIEHGGLVARMEAKIRDRHDGLNWLIDVRFNRPLEAAIFLATISADPERAAMFKMFWGGSE